MMFEENLGYRSRQYNSYFVGDNYIVEVEVPGFRIDDLSIELVGNMLYVNGKRDMGNTGVNFSKAFTINPTTNKDGIKADYENGILKVTIPKPETRKIPINEVIEAEAHEVKEIEK